MADLKFDKPTNSVNELYTIWNTEAVRYTETPNKILTIQAAQTLHRCMKLDTATSVLEIAAGAGIGSLDILNYLKDSAVPSKQFRITDLTPAMIDLAKERIHPNDYAFPVSLETANGQDLVNIADASVDRYIASFVLQMAPDTTAMLRECYRVLQVGGVAGFVIWGRPEESGIFTILHRIDPLKNINNFYLGQDMPKLHELFKSIGFSSVVSWTSLCVYETSDATRYTNLMDRIYPVEDPANASERRAKVTAAAQAWLDNGKAIGLETYLILATK